MILGQNLSKIHENGQISAENLPTIDKKSKSRKPGSVCHSILLKSTLKLIYSEYGLPSGSESVSRTILALLPPSRILGDPNTFCQKCARRGDPGPPLSPE